MSSDTNEQQTARKGSPKTATIGRAREAVHVASAQVGQAVGALRASMPEVARSSRDLAGEAFQRIEAGSDPQISAGATMSLGLVIGMVLFGAPRLLIALALIPVAAVGFVLVERRGSGRSAGSPPATR